jgi:DNA polymerase Ligase (LigD)
MSNNNKLSKYRAKRDFSKTAEPSGQTKIASNRRRFIIQKHAATRLHYDLRLELDGVFKSWAVTRGPSLDPHESGSRSRSRITRSIMGTSRELSPRANMAAGRFSFGTADIGSPKATRRQRKRLLAAISSSGCKDSVCTAAGF